MKISEIRERRDATYPWEDCGEEWFVAALETCLKEIDETRKQLEELHRAASRFQLAAADLGGVCEPSCDVILMCADQQLDTALELAGKLLLEKT